MNALTLGTTAIRQYDGLYSLNDLHNAAGGDKNQQPANFIRLDQTQALIAEINSSEMRSLKIITGRNGGTYVCRELVYAYAMWISPKFNLQVIRAFDALVSQQPAPKSLPAPTDTLSPASAALPAPAPLIDAAMQRLLFARFCLTFDEHGRMALREIPERAYMIAPEDFARIIGDPNCNVDKQYLGDIIRAATNRLAPKTAR